MNAGCVLRVVVLRAHACTPAISDQAHDVNECRRSRHGFVIKSHLSKMCETSH